MKRKGFVFLLVFFLLQGVLFAEGIQDFGRDGELILLHTNDYHGSTLTHNGRGGIAEIAEIVNAVKLVNRNVLLLDAGDINTGTALSNMFNAEPDFLGYNMIGYDAVVFGNHEFDGGREKLDRQIELADFPFVSSNIRRQDGSFLGGNQYIVKNYGNFTVGIFGLTTLRTKITSSPDSSLIFIDEIEAARQVVEILRNTEKADIIIGLTHMGDVKENESHVTSIELAQAVAGIDIIVDGHSHSYMASPKKAGNTFIVSANEWGKYIGYGRMTIKDGKLINFNWVPIPVGPDIEVSRMLNPYIEKANAALKEVIGEASDTFIFGNRLTRYEETSIGNMICDANVWYFKNASNLDIDFAFHNGGNIRAELPKGPITVEQILTILPFDNYLYLVSMSGSELIELFNFIATISQGAGAFPQFSREVRLTIDKTSGSGKVTDLTIGGMPVEPNRTYRFCTNDYILGGGDGYTIMKNAKDQFNASLLLSYAVTEYIKAQGIITPVLDGRLKIIGGVAH